VAKAATWRREEEESGRHGINAVRDVAALFCFRARMLWRALFLFGWQNGRPASENARVAYVRLQPLHHDRGRVSAGQEENSYSKRRW